MEVEYIVAIVSGGVFLLLLVLYIVMYFRGKKREEMQWENISKMYASRNLVKMKYAFAAYDAETEKIIAEKQSGDDSQITIDDLVRAEAAAAAVENVLSNVESEGVEEITGNYKSENGN